MSRFVLALSVICAGSLLVSRHAEAQKVEVARPATASSSEGSGYQWYETHVDPDNANNMLICGTEWNARDNANYGFVYYSADGGARWTRALEDKNSRWVTEQSCAYGVHGVAYFVSCASKVIDGFPHHNQGTTRVYVSRDAGKTWKVGLKTGWTDASISVVDTSLGPNQNTVYVFFNGLDNLYQFLGKTDAAKSEKENGDRVGMISYKDGDADIKGPFSSTAVGKEKNKGAFPTSALLLRDGSIVVIYSAGRKAEKDAAISTVVEAVRTAADRSTLEVPVKIGESADNSAEVNGEYCGAFYNSAAGYDSARDRLYFVYPAVRQQTCHLFLTTSTDGGRSWAKAQQVVSPDETRNSGYLNPTIAINQEGILAVMWEHKRHSGCWMFAVSGDGGASLSRAERIGTCDAQEKQGEALATANLWTVVYQADASGGRSDAARFILRNNRNAVQRNEGAIAVTPDGIFHPVWIDSRTENGGLRTAAVHVISAAALIASGTKSLDDVTSKIAILYGGDQRYDAESGIITVDLVVQNKSAGPIHTPLKLAVPSLPKDHEYADIANADNGATAGGAVWDISTSIPGGALDPGATSRPFPLKFRYLPAGGEVPPLTSEDFLELDVKVFAGSEEAPKSY